jgi:glycosyltransferase involved in cell wall biosynthesis
MKITVFVPGRFHAFYLVSQLIKKGVSSDLITTYPRFVATKYGIPAANIKSFFLLEAIRRSWEKLPACIRNLYNIDYFISDFFDRLASKEVSECDICIGWSGSSLHTFRKAKTRGAKTILQRGSTHILYQQKIVSEEFRIWGCKFNGIHPQIIEKELKEYAESDFIEVPSSFARQSFRELGISDNKIIQSFRGVDLGEFKQLPKNDGIFRVIFAGNISLRKGVQYLLKAFKEARLPKAELLLIGSISDEVRKLLKSYDGYYKWAGHLPQTQLYRYYSQGSCFVMPSIEEGMAVVQLQAMSSGLPLICTRNSGGTDIIREGIDGFSVPMRDSEALKEKITFFYENPDSLKNMGINARKQVIQNYTWGHYADFMLGHYNRIIEGNG